VDPYGKQELLGFYSRHLEHFGDTPQAVRWTSAGQRSRYEALLALAGPLGAGTVLDFGCGKGDFYGFLLEKGIETDYCGADVNPGLIGLARRKHPGGEFLLRDIEEEGMPRTFDVIVICGVFNLRIAGIADTLKTVLRILFAACRRSLHLNIPSTRSSWKDSDIFYADPGELLEFARRELSKESVVREDILPGELFLSAVRV
jgi:SAM-dependent methyltransferase